MRFNSFFFKLLIILSVLLLTFLYAQYEKQKYYSHEDNLSNELVLKTLPDFNSIEVTNGKAINSYDLLKGRNGVFVHIWGSWCSPCEKEMPEFLKYAAAVQEKGVRFLLVAVNDDLIKVKKFMGRFSFPTNVTVTIDQENKVMDLFGTLKVPETFLFDSSGKTINKFIGPQDWAQESYQTRLDFWLNSQNTQNYIDRIIETR